jgi:hypothetical protein
MPGLVRNISSFRLIQGTRSDSNEQLGPCKLNSVIRTVALLLRQPSRRWCEELGQLR